MKPSGLKAELGAGKPPQLEVKERTCLFHQQVKAMEGRAPHLPASLVYIVNRFDGIQMVDSWIESHFIENHDSSFFHCLLEIPHSIRDVRGSHDVLPVLDSTLDDRDMVDVWKQRNDEIMIPDESIERGLVLDITRGS